MLKTQRISQIDSGFFMAYYNDKQPNETAIGGAEVPIESVERLIALAKQGNPDLRL